MRVLIRFKGGTAQEVKMAYMQRVEDFEKESEVMPNRLRLRRYLRELLLNQTRVLKHTAEMVLRKREEKDPFLILIEHKKKESKTMYFEDKNAPGKMDLEIYNDIKSKGAELKPEEFPELFAWYNLIGTFSEKIRNNWQY